MYEGVPTLVAMREHNARLAGMASPHVLGLLFCQECGCTRPFVSLDAHCKHITDAGCDTCGFVYGRKSTPEVRRGVVRAGQVVEVIEKAKRDVPVISDSIAADAAAAWREAMSGPQRTALAEAPRPMPIMPPEDDAHDESRVRSFLRSQT